MMALKQLGVEKVIAMCAVGSLNPEMRVGDLVLLDQFMDLAWNRNSTFGIHSVNMTNPFCEKLRNNFLEAAKEQEIAIHERGNYICVGGPRYETALEIKVYRSWGMDVVGMTNTTEATLARELGLCYSCVALITDMAAGLTEVEPDLALHQSVTKDNMGKIKKLLFNTAMKVDSDKDCSCQEFYRKAISARKK